MGITALEDDQTGGATLVERQEDDLEASDECGSSLEAGDDGRTSLEVGLEVGNKVETSLGADQ